MRTIDPHRRAVVAAVLLVASLAAGCAATPEPSTAFVLRGATLIDGTGATPVENAAVVVTGGRITAVGPSGTVAIPEGARIVELTDRWIVPGLWDLHVHLTKTKEEALPLLLGAGVTSVRDMGSDLAEVRAMEARIEDGSIDGPRIWTPGPMLERPETLERMAGLTTGEPWRRTRVAVADPASAARIVDSLADLGVDFVKIREAAAGETYAAIVAAARARGLRVAGHAPFGTDPVEGAALGLASIEHASYPYPLDTLPARRREILDAFAESGMAIVPTLVAWRTNLMHPDSVALLIADTAGVRDPRRPLLSDFLVGEWVGDLEDAEPKSAEALAGWAGFLDRTGADLAAMRAAGVPILPGSDLASIALFPGFSLHEELEALVDCVGLTPAQAIEAATREAAAVLGAADSLGTIEPGKRADLVVLDADPTRDVANTRRIVAVVKEGRWYGPEALARLRGGVPLDARGDVTLLPGLEAAAPGSTCALPRRSAAAGTTNSIDPSDPNGEAP